MANNKITSKEKADLILEALCDKKAVDPVVIDVHARTIMMDYLVIATGTSKIHIRALADAVVEKLSAQRIKNKRLEGEQEGLWMLLDYGDVVVHLLSPEQREFYRLEQYWSGAEKGSPPILEG
ncbi:MAG: ribosome silencing factor [Armatimonadota bacterium]|jgi:ribosome-associated protein|nr:ribosome silencing factor [Armatimonadota bacterium]